jgi:fucose permease
MGIIGLIDFVDGSEMIFTTLLPNILKTEWNLTTLEISLFGSVFYIGLFFGALFSGILCDVIGRKLTLNIGCSVDLIIIIFTIYAQNAV